MVYGTCGKHVSLKTMIYEVEFSNEDIKEYAANIISKNMLMKVDLYGSYLTRMKVIIGYHRDNAVAILKSDIYVVTIKFQKNMNNTPIGWNLPIKWAYDSESWIALNDKKEAHPVKIW